MKRYIRTTNNKFYDTIKERYLIDDNRLVLCHEYETHPTMTDGNVVLSVYITNKHVEYINCGIIADEADDIFSLLQTGDLVKAFNDSIVEIQHICKGIITDKTSNDYLLEYITQFYTKQKDNYVLVWSKDKGVI